jgi:hypothetical protein
MIESLVESSESTIECTSCEVCKEILDPEDFDDIQILEFTHLRGNEATKKIIAICPNCTQLTSGTILQTAKSIIQEVCPNHKVFSAKVQIVK